MSTASQSDANARSVEARTFRKIRARIVPYLFLLYIVAFLDRTNIGFAALTMNRELGITAVQFGVLSGIFFWGYFLFEIPSNLLMHKIGARIWIARILVTWGVVAVLTGFVRNTPQLYVARFLLGIAEAGFFPGIILYLTYWFRQRELAQALALFIAAAPVSGFIGAPVSVFILDRVHWLGISGWRWLLVLEGLPAILCGVITYFVLPSRPAEASFLSGVEKAWLIKELAREEEAKVEESAASAVSVFSHRRVWHLALTWFTYQIGVYAMYFWMPQMVKSVAKSYSNRAVGTFVMIPYLAGVIAMVLVSRSSDRRLERKYHGAACLLVAGIGLMLLGRMTTPWQAVMLWSVIAMGISSFNGPFWAVPNQFLAGVAGASGIAFINSVGNLGGFVGPATLGWIGQKTGNLHAGLAFAGGSLFLSATLMLLIGGGTRTIARESETTAN
ncbi:MAG: MFS transporter [Acidobacteriaceae bacterium]